MKRFAIGTLVVALLLTAVSYFGAAWYFSDRIIGRETTPVAESRSRLDGPAEYGLPAPEEVTISNDDTTLTGWFFDNPAPGECAVVLLHGFTGNRYGVLQYSPLFWERGCDLVAYDARGHGNSTPTYHTFGYYEKEDAAQVVAWVRNRTGLADEDIGLAGVSYGAATSLQTAPLVPDVAFVLADSAYQDMESIITHQAVEQFGDWIKLFVPGALWVSELRAGFDTTAVSPSLAARAVQDTDTPLLIIHSLQDEYTPPAHSETIYDNSNPDTTAVHIVDWGAPHGRAILYEPEQYAILVDAFLAEHAPDFGLQE